MYTARWKLIIAVIAAASLGACAAQTGNIQAIVALPSRVSQPWRPPAPQPPPEPERPSAFPTVQLVWAYAAEPGAAGVSTSRPSPVRVASLQPEPIPGPDEPPLDDGLEPEPEPDEPPLDDVLVPEAEPGGLTASPGAGLPIVAVESELSFPGLPDDPGVEETRFHELAQRTLEKLYAEDQEDPSVLLSLYEKLMTDVSLARQRDGWRAPIESGISRAETLQRASAAVRGLRTAFEGASPTGEPGIYTGIDLPKCRSALAHLYKADPSAVDLAVTVEGVGRVRLADLERACKSSNEAELASRQFPELLGPAKLRKIVRRSYRRAFKRRKVRKVSIPNAGWEVLDDGKRRVLRAIIGVRRKNAFPEAPCLMQEVTIEQKKRRRRYGKPVCCQIKSSVAIKCSELERKH